jgi:hypothetical protein
MGFICVILNFLLGLPLPFFIWDIVYSFYLMFCD